MDIMSLYPTGMTEPRKQEIHNRMDSIERQLENCRYNNPALIAEYEALEKELNELNGTC
jgi:chromosome segregation ATPase